MKKTREGQKKKGLTIEKKRVLEAYFFLLPWLIGTAIFFLNPLIRSIILSFSEIVQLKGFVMKWVGLVNYEYIMVYDINFMPTFVEVVLDTVINTPLTLVFSLIIAMMINRPMAGRGFFRTAFFLPVLLGSGYVMDQLLQIGATGEVGVGIALPVMLQGVLGNTLSGLIQAFLDRITLILWKSGVQILLFLAGLQGISSSLYEAAKCDGATQWEMFWKVTLPMISPIILLNFVYSMVSSFASADNALIKYALKQIFTNKQFEKGAAMGWLYLAFVFVLCGAVFGIAGLLSKKEERV